MPLCGNMPNASHGEPSCAPSGSFFGKVGRGVPIHGECALKADESPSDATPHDDRDMALKRRFGTESPHLDLGSDAPLFHRELATRGSVRSFAPEPVPFDTLRRLCALALCAPTKSDLQQRDIVIVDDAQLRRQIVALLTHGPLGQAWLNDAPALLVFCGNNRRQRLWHSWRGKSFANDHLDAFFNAAVDAAIALSAF